MLSKSTEQVLLNLPGYVFWKNKNHVFLGCNHTFASILNYQHGLDIAGITDYELPCELSEDAAEFQRQDDDAVQGNNITTINFHQYADDQKRILLTQKAPLYDDYQNIIGTIGNSIQLTQGALHQLSHVEY